MTQLEGVRLKKFQKSIRYGPPQCAPNVFMKNLVLLLQKVLHIIIQKQNYSAVTVLHSGFFDHIIISNSFTK